MLLRLACCALPCSSSRKQPSCTWLSNFLWNSFDSGTQEQRKLNLECPEGFLCKRIPTQIVANTHTNIYIGLFSRKRTQTSNLRHTTAVDNRRRRSSLFISGQVGSVMAVEHVHRGHCLCAAVSLIRSQVVLTKSRNVHAYLFNRLAPFVFHSSFFIEKWKGKEILCLRFIIYLVYLNKYVILI